MLDIHQYLTTRCGVSEDRSFAVANDLVEVSLMEPRDLRGGIAAGQGNFTRATRGVARSVFGLVPKLPTGPHASTHLVQEWRRLVGQTNHLTFEDIVELELGRPTDPTGRQLCAAGMLLRGGVPQRNVAADTGVSLSTVSELATWTGVNAWVDEQLQDRAIIAVESGKSFATWHAGEDVGTGKARRVWRDAVAIVDALE